MSDASIIIVDRSYSQVGFNPEENCVGWSHFVVGESDEKLRVQLRAITQQADTELPRILRREKPDIIHGFLSALMEINGCIESPFWQACDINARGTSLLNHLHQEAVLLQNSSWIHQYARHKPGLILANLSFSGAQELERQLLKCGVRVRRYSRGIPRRSRRLLLFARFIKNSLRFALSSTLMRSRHGALRGLSTRATPSDLLLVSYGLPRSFTEKGFHDLYFHPLYAALQGTQVEVLRLLLGVKRPSTMAHIENEGDALPTTTPERLMSLRDPWRGILGLLQMWMEARWVLRSGKLSAGTQAIAPSLAEALDELMARGTGLSESLIYFCSRRLARHVKTVLYPFENLSWERAMLTGLKAQAGSSPRTVGFQHSTLVPLHLPARLARGEAENPSVVLPDQIITTGPLASECMASRALYPTQILNDGCSLRTAVQCKNPNPSKRRKLAPWNILVVLNTVQDAIGVLRFIERAALKSKDFNVVKLRFHPLYGLSEVARYCAIPKQAPYVLDAEPNLFKSAAGVDVILYCGSMAALECMHSLGTPIVQIDINDVLGYDVFSDMKGLKSTASEPGELTRVIEDILSMDDDRYVQAHRESKAYFEQYCCPPTDERVSQFLNSVLIPRR